jgi:aquaporin Z
MSLLGTLRGHWPEYTIEAWALGTFMISAGVFTALVEHPDFIVRQAIEDAFARRSLVGLAMGATAVALIYSPWGRRSGAHMDPAVTLTFLRLGKIARADAGFFIAAQFAGALLGVLAAFALLGERFAGAPVSFVATEPGSFGRLMAFSCELLISGGLMATVLVFSGSPRLESFTGIAAGVLVAVYVAIEAPFSGMSMNPARSFASAAAAGSWGNLWIYFVAPPLGMLVAAEIYARFVSAQSMPCAKLYHAEDVRCIHCGYEPLHGDQIHDDPAKIEPSL